MFTTPSVLHITSYYTARAYGSTRARQVLLTLLNDIQVIDSDHSTVLVALNSGMEDFEDSLQYFTALKCGMSYFVSADKKLKRAAIPQLPVYTPSGLLKELVAE